MRVWLKRVLTGHWLVTLGLMGVAALVFGLATVNLYALLHANVTLIAAHGAMALRDGALAQLAELIAYSYVGVAAYVLFKACERVLVERLLG